MIQLTGLTKSFGERVLLDDVTWQVTDGERVGLCGPNGAGKTTLLRMLAGLDEPDRGAIIRPAGADGRLPAAGRARTFRPHALRRSVARVSAAARRARAKSIASSTTLADPALPDGEHEALLVRYHDAHASSSAARKATASICA